MFHVKHDGNFPGGQILFHVEQSLSDRIGLKSSGFTIIRQIKEILIIDGIYNKKAEF